MTWIILIALAAAGWYFFKRQRSRKPDLSFLPEQFVIFDLETTGLSPDRSKIIEIGAIRANRDSIHHDALEVLIKIRSRVPTRITEMTGITDDMLQANGKPLAEALDEFVAFIGDRRLIAFNAPFDMNFINAALESCGKQRLRNPVSCALDMSRRAFPGRRSYRLRDLARDGQLGSQRHRALADCELTLHVYAGAAHRLRSID